MRTRTLFSVFGLYCRLVGHRSRGRQRAESMADAGAYGASRDDSRWGPRVTAERSACAYRTACAITARSIARL